MTRIIYEPEDIKFWLEILSRTPGANQRGGNIPGFAGLRFQRGAGLGSFFQGLFRAALPIISSIGASVGKQAMRSTAHLMNDVVDGKDIRMALKSRGKEAITALGQKGMDALNQSGSGRVRKRKQPTMATIRSRRYKRKSVRLSKRTTKRRQKPTKRIKSSPLFEHAHL